jgi:hypothetical protein
MEFSCLWTDFDLIYEDFNLVHNPCRIALNVVDAVHSGGGTE